MFLLVGFGFVTASYTANIYVVFVNVGSWPGDNLREDSQSNGKRLFCLFSVLYLSYFVNFATYIMWCRAGLATHGATRIRAPYYSAAV